MLISIDFEKCFDTIEIDALMSAMEFFGFGKEFMQWVALLYQDFQLCVNNNGYCSEWFNPTGGIHQGCPDSGFNFLLCTEILALKIKNNQNITGIEIGPDIVETLSQFADDTNVFSVFTQDSLQAIIDTFHEYKEHTGLKTNFEKKRRFFVLAH